MDANELVVRIRAGEHALAPLLVSVLAPTLLGYAATVAADLGDADRERICEVAVETAAARIDRFDPDIGPFEAWVLPFVQHAAADVRRSRRGVTVVSADEIPDASAPPTVPTDAELERSASLALLISRLPETDQRLLSLRFGPTRPTWAQLSADLDVPEAALRQRCSRALARLRRLADEDPSLPA